MVVTEKVGRQSSRSRTWKLWMMRGASYGRKEERLLEEPRSQIKLPALNVARYTSRSILLLTSMQDGKLRLQEEFIEAMSSINTQNCQHSIRFEHNKAEDGKLRL